MNKINLKTPVACMDIDSQYSFTPQCPDELPVPHGDEIVPELNEQAKFAQYRIGSKEAHPVHAIWFATPEQPTLSKIQDDNVDVRWPKHCIPGTKGFEQLKGLPHPSQYDFFVWKGIEPDMHPYGSCFHDLNEKLSTGIIEFLRDKGVKTVIVGGLATDYCVKNTVLQLLNAGFETIVNLAACRGLNPLTTSLAISQMKNHGAIIIDSCDVLNTNPAFVKVTSLIR
ncbi:MAG: isochorismatase family protein [Proteobacteria bacterium]|nr:isochorismatase family protein [Pseudomonadota bacterium]